MNYKFKKHLKGRILDIGCRDNKYGGAIGLDLIKTKDTDYIGSADNMVMFKNDYFDGIYCSNVIEHLKDIENTFKEIKRVLKIGGRAVIICPNHSYKHFWDDYTHVRPYTPTSLIRLCSDVGLKVLVATTTSIL